MTMHTYILSLPTTTVSVNTALTAADVGKVIGVDTSGVVITLPAIGTNAYYTIMNVGQSGHCEISVSPNASDYIIGCGREVASATDNKDLVNTGTTSVEGDFVTLAYYGAGGWIVTQYRGTWAYES